jgi:hypothetical protein
MVDENKLVNLGALAFFRLHPLVSMQGAGGGGVRVIKGDAVNGQGSVDKACRILHGTIGPVVNYNGILLTHAPNCRKAVRATLGMGVAGIPIFHLPYNNDQNFRVTLVDRQGIGNVNVFLTEFVDGCSIYIEGSRTAPTAYHINAVSVRRPRRRIEFWSTREKRRRDWVSKSRHMDQRFQNDPNHRPKSVVNALPGALLPISTKLENEDYMAPVNLDVPTLQFQMKVPLFVGPDAVDGVEIMAQQGSVFGERDPGNGEWTFYVQKRVLLAFLNHAAGRIGFQWLITSVDEFWPNTTTGRPV